MPKYVLEFSGGRDSLALLKLWEPFKAETVVLWVDAGGTLPEVRQLILTHTAGWDLRICETDANSWIEKHGYPADIIPLWYTARGQWVRKPEDVMIAPSFSCCAENVMKPLHLAALALQPEFIVRGQRNTETFKSPARDGADFGNFKLLFPLQDWTDAQVNEYLKTAGVELPEWYAYGTKGFDCWWCTGFAKESAGLRKYLKLRHPEKSAIVEQRMMDIQKAIVNELWF
jgi:phosphoadenosine phosphosulfate reductase